MGEHIQAIQPEGWPRPRGFSSGMRAQGTVIRVSGHFGKVPGETSVPADADFGVQWTQALKNVVAVVEAGGGKASDIVMLRAFVTSVQDFKDHGAAIAAGWAEALGKHFPAMTLVQISALLDPNALVEIEGEAVLAG